MPRRVTVDFALVLFAGLIGCFFHAGPAMALPNGNCSGATFTGPIYEYSHSSGCASTTGGAFVPDGFWPATYDNTYLFADYVCNKIFELTPRTGGGFDRKLFAGGLGTEGPIALDFGPYGTGDRALYYTSFAGGGQVRRIFHTGAT